MRIFLRIISEYLIDHWYSADQGREMLHWKTSALLPSHIFSWSCTLNPTETLLFCDVGVSASCFKVCNFNNAEVSPVPPSAQADRMLRLKLPNHLIIIMTQRYLFNKSHPKVRHQGIQGVLMLGFAGPIWMEQASLLPPLCVGSFLRSLSC